MPLLGDRAGAAKYSPIPVNDMTNSTDVVPVTGEVVSIAAGAAGTAVSVIIDKAPIYDSKGARVANENNSSISWTTGTVFTTEIGLDYKLLEQNHAGKKSEADIITSVTANMSNGEYAFDYENGILYGVKATTATSDTVAYNTRARAVVVTTSGGGDGGEGVFAEDTAHTTADKGMHMLAVRDDSLAAKTSTDGDYGSLSIDDLGHLYAILRGYDSSTDASKTFEVAAIWAQHVEETIADVTNETNATVERFTDMDGYNHLAIQFEKTGGADSVTLTVEGSMQDDGTGSASVVYQDITQYGFDISTAASTAASYTADAIITLKTDTNYKFIKIKTVSAGGANDADYALYIKRWFA